MALAGTAIGTQVICDCLGMCVRKLTKEARTFFSVKKLMKELQDQKELVIFEKQVLQNRIDIATMKTQVIEKRVENLLMDINNSLDEVATLEDCLKNNKLFFKIPCGVSWPTLHRYLILKKVVKKTEAIKRFKDASMIEPISRSPTPKGDMKWEATHNFKYFKSTEAAEDKLLQAFQDDQTHVIGLYGMVGSGKTALAIEAGKKAKEMLLFDHVILLTASQTPNIPDLQYKIADAFDMKLRPDSDTGKSSRLAVLLKEKRILYIVDDLWNAIDLKRLGTWFGTDYKNNSTVLITTRDLRVCISMQCEKNICLEVITEEESWDLFKMQANIDDAFSSTLEDVPQKICSKCKGLLMAISVLGSFLKDNKSKEVWEITLGYLTNNPEEININQDQNKVMTGVEFVLYQVKLSYEWLAPIEKLVLLMCTIFTEGHKISVEDLIQNADGFRKEATFPLTDFGINAAVKRLLGYSLLMLVGEKEGKKEVKMHDIIRAASMCLGKETPYQPNLVRRRNMILKNSH